MKCNCMLITHILFLFYKSESIYGNIESVPGQLDDEVQESEIQSGITSAIYGWLIYPGEPCLTFSRRR